MSDEQKPGGENADARSAADTAHVRSTGDTADGRSAADTADGRSPSAERDARRASSKDPRLDAVLDVDLPLVVRFGRAIMPLRALADLGPGSVIDMGRSPDEPVELLVGDRLIARGEVVIVGGNDGVRITELAATRASNGLEARA